MHSPVEGPWALRCGVGTYPILAPCSLLTIEDKSVWSSTCAFSCCWFLGRSVVVFVLVRVIAIILRIMDYITGPHDGHQIVPITIWLNTTSYAERSLLFLFLLHFNRVVWSKKEGICKRYSDAQVTIQPREINTDNKCVFNEQWFFT